MEEYLRELEAVALLSREEETALWKAFKENGDTEARRRLIEAYQPLVFKTAAPYRAYEGVMDLVQEGTVGLLEAAESYDPTKGVAFSLYAVHRIRGRMFNYWKKEMRADAPSLDYVGEEMGCSEKELLPDTALSVAEQAEEHELIARLRQAMDRLPQKEKLVLERVAIDAAPVQDVAELLGVTAGHIYRLQKTGIRRVRGMLSRFMQQW